MNSKKIVGVIVGACLCLSAISSVLVEAASNGVASTIPQKVSAMESLSPVTSKAEAPTAPEPAWLTRQKTARVVTYSVATRGVITADIAEFKADANETLNNPKGWAALGVRFEEVTSGGMFTLYLAEASEIPSFSPVCSTLYSCTVGNIVAINQDRWLGATTPWNEAGLSLRDYRNLVVDHETGHWLGHPDTNTCSGVGQPAPVMAQQSITRGGCNFNPWPLSSELWSTRLGITV